MDDIEKREKVLKKEQDRRRKQEEKEVKAQARAEILYGAHNRKKAFLLTAGGREKGRAIRTMFLSSAILLLLALAFELIHYVRFGGWGDMQTHLLNMADNTLAFVIGLGAMDAVIYFSHVKRDRRDEYRAVMRHHRLMEPMIEAFVFRKNVLTQASDDEIQQYDIIGRGDLAGLARMFDPSFIQTDAGISRIRVYSQQQKQLYKQMQKLIEDVNFTFYPAVGEGAMGYIKASTAGFSSLMSILALEENGNKAKKDSLVKAIQAEAVNPSAVTNTKIMAAEFLLQSIRDQEAALKKYLDQVNTLQVSRRCTPAGDVGT